MQRLRPGPPLVYVAGPLFSQAELAYNIEIAALIGKHLDVYLPQRDGGKLVDLIKKGVPRDAAYSSIFDRDIQAIQESEVLFLILDGRSVDEGAAFELGYAFALGKVCIGLQTDPRRLLPLGNNPMIQMPLRRVLSRTEDVGPWAASYAQSAAEVNAARNSQ